MRILAVLLLVTAAVTTSLAPQYSALWGERGEKWSPAGRLPDFSYAGYHSGEAPIPDVPAAGGVNVRDFGAVGDGEHDDSEALLKAIAAVNRGVVFLPAGRYKITKIIEIRKPGVVLRGAGPERTTLVFPIPLTDIRPDWGATTEGSRTSNYSWSGGFVWLRGDTGRIQLANITAEAKRGETVLALSTTQGMRAGRRVEIAQNDDEANSLAAHLYSEDPGDTTKLRRTRASLVSRIRAVSGNSITLERPLRFDVKPAWKPRVLSFEPSVSESGVEHLRFEFPAGEYKGHFTELGLNPVALSGVADCWVRDIRISNAESGPFVTGAFNTIEQVVYDTVRKPFQYNGKGREYYGHHGIYMGGDDNLFTGFDFRMTFVHDISVSRCAGNVIAGGKGLDLDFDHHKAAPYENLYTDVDAGAGKRLWACGGGKALGRQCGARGTFWNIRARSPLTAPPAGWGPASMNLVALFTEQPTETSAGGRWFEAITPDRIAPRDIHQAQVEWRLAGRQR